MEYNFKEIEQNWQKFWSDNQMFKAENNSAKPKYYALDMFPYPSGAGLHVGHPLGYIASDIVSRYKRLKGFNVLHPMGFDAFGLPAEQYAIQTGQHPAVTTEKNIDTYKTQLRQIGFSFDWSREVRTCAPDYYRWTQWIFMRLFESWYDKIANKARHINDLAAIFTKEGNITISAEHDEDVTPFSAADWSKFSEKEQQTILLKYRLAFLSEATVNWCPALGTVLANDEVKDGYSERGGYPVERKLMKQWSLRITAYAERLLQGLEKIDWPEPVKEMQRNWIGKSIGAELDFKVKGQDITLTVFTTRIDTIFGVTYLSIAPEHELISQLTTPEQAEAVAAYVDKAKNRSERDRMADVKTVSGVFTGSYVTNPFTNEQVPLWIADYVLAGYGTGVVMAVPSSDDRDFRFAQHFKLPIINVIDGTEDLEVPTEIKYGRMINSGFLNGLETAAAIEKAAAFAEENGFGKRKINYRMRDAVFGRQRYWGEPVPVFFKDDLPYLIEEKELPLILPEIDEYKPTETGEPPLGRAEGWKYQNQYEYELSTMPGWAGSSWYFYRYMDAQNANAFVGKEAEQYWQFVDLYIGGSEHATGHLLYARFWAKFLFDLGFVTRDEPFQKLINQGMIQGRSNFVYRIKETNKFVSFGLKDNYDVTALHVDVNIVKNEVLDLDKFKAWLPEYANAEFILENNKYICGWEVEKMSKRWYNVVNPDDIISEYGADTLRMYEMFLGPLEQFKPWNTNGIEGVHKFLKRLWRLFYDDKGNLLLSDAEPTAEELKILHKTIRKVAEDIDRFSFNTSVSMFMVCVNELTTLKCHKRAILQDLVLLLSPYAPHISEELWKILGHTTSLSAANFPEFNETYLVENTFEYAISINGKVRAKLSFEANKPAKEIEDEVLANEAVQKWLEGKAPKKVIVVPNKIVNLVM